MEVDERKLELVSEKSRERISGYLLVVHILIPLYNREWSF
jgi:hypothetical protein